MDVVIRHREIGIDIDLGLVDRIVLSPVASHIPIHHRYGQLQLIIGTSVK